MRILKIGYVFFTQIRVLALLVSLFITSIIKSQDVFFSQYQYSPLLINPAYTTNDYDIKAIAHFRNQFRSPDPNYRTPSFTFVMPFLKKNTNMRWGGIGMSAHSDQTGTFPLLLNQGIGLSYAHNVYLGKGYNLSLGVQGGYYQYGFSTNSFSTESQFSNNGGYNPNMSNGENLNLVSRNYLDLATGLNFIKEDTTGRRKFFLSVSAHHLNQPNRSLLEEKNSLPYMFYIHGGITVFSNSEWLVEPEILFANQASFQRYTIGIKTTYYLRKETSNMLREASIAFIPKYTYQNSLALGLELLISNFLVAFSYDYGTSALATRVSGRGAYEIAIGYRKSLFKKKKPASIIDYSLGDIKRIYLSENIEDISKDLKNERERKGYNDELSDTDTNWYKANNHKFELDKQFRFGFNEVGLKEDAKKFADDMFDLLQANPRLKLYIIGYSDNIGTEKANQYISTERANSFVKYISTKGINPKRLKFEGKGEGEPISSNRTEAERAKNRRVRFLIF